MLSCDECQTKMVVVFDGEGNEGDENLISVHLKQCPDCRAFREDMLGIASEFESIPIATMPASPGLRLPDQPGRIPSQRESFRPRGNTGRMPSQPGFRRLAWVGGMAGLLVLVFACISCFILAREVVSLRRELKVARRYEKLFAAAGASAIDREKPGRRILSAGETRVRLQELLSVGTASGTQWPLRTGVVQTNLALPGKTTPEDLAVVARFWRDRIGFYVRERISALRELREISDPSFHPIIQSYLAALEAYIEGRVRDSVELLLTAERLWEALGGKSETARPEMTLPRRGI
jgi:hypothetical protein